MKVKKARAVFIHRNRKKGKTEYSIKVSEYFGSATRNAKEIKYPEFRKVFSTYKEAFEYIEKTCAILSQRYKNTVFETRFAREVIG